MSEPKSDEEIMQDVMPGSTTFKPNILCPKCGWSFKRGVTDPSGAHTAFDGKDSAITVCGQCLSPIQFDPPDYIGKLLTADDIRKFPREIQEHMVSDWKLAFMVLALVGKEKPGTKQ